MDLEVPLGKRTKKYRFLEMLPALLSYGSLITLVVLSILEPIIASIYLLFIILTALVKVVGISYRMIQGRINMDKAALVDWHQRLEDLSNPKTTYTLLRETKSDEPLYYRHLENLRLMAAAEDGFFPKNSDIYNVLIMPAYNEDIAVIEPALRSVLDTTYDMKHLIIVNYQDRKSVV